MKEPFSRKKLCSVKDHAEHGEVAAICPRCYDAALRWQATQVRIEQKAAHEEYLALRQKAA